MKLMLDKKHLTIGQVRQAVARWRYDNDTPANFERDYLAYYNEQPPRE